MKPIEIQTDGDRLFLVGEWPAETEISLGLLKGHNGKLRLETTRVTLEVEGAHATYEVDFTLESEPQSLGFRLIAAAGVPTAAPAVKAIEPDAPEVQIEQDAPKAKPRGAKKNGGAVIAVAPEAELG